MLSKVLKSKIFQNKRRIFCWFLVLLAVEWIFVYGLNAYVLRGDVHLQERLNSERVDWNKMVSVKDWNCKSYDVFIYSYHTCFRSSSNIKKYILPSNNKYVYYKSRPFLTPSRIFWPTSERFRYIAFTTLGYNPGDRIGIVLLDGRWMRCKYKRNTSINPPDPRLCPNTSHYRNIKNGVWNNDYIK